MTTSHHYNPPRHARYDVKSQLSGDSGTANQITVIEHARSAYGCAGLDILGLRLGVGQEREEYIHP